MEQTCATCKWSKFEMTNHKPPRIKNTAGRCEWPVPTAEAFPVSVTKCFGFNLSKSFVWPHTANCPVWESK